MNGLSILGPSPSPFLAPVPCGINRNWGLAKGRSMPARAAGSLAEGLSQEKKKKANDCDLHSSIVDVGRGSGASPYPASACPRSVLRAMGCGD